MKLINTVLIWVGVFALTLVLFYGIDQFIMAVQGLPLNLDMTPVQ